MNKNKYILYLIPVILFIIFLQILMHEGMDSKQDKINIEFPCIARDSSITGVVETTKNYVGSIPKGALLITLDDGLKFSANADAIPKEIERKRDNITSLFLYNFLSKGDSICKPSYKDSLYVYKGDKKYTFFYTSKEMNDKILKKQKEENKYFFW